MFRPRRPLSTAWLKCPASVVIDSATYLLTISSPDIDNVAMSLYSINTLDLLPGNSAQSASMISSAPLWLLCSLLKWRTTEIVHHNVCLQMCGPISYVLEIGHCHSVCNVGGVGCVYACVCVCVCVRMCLGFSASSGE